MFRSIPVGYFNVPDVWYPDISFRLKYDLLRQKLFYYYTRHFFAGDL